MARVDFLCLRVKLAGIPCQTIRSAKAMKRAQHHVEGNLPGQPGCTVHRVQKTPSSQQIHDEPG